LSIFPDARQWWLPGPGAPAAGTPVGLSGHVSWTTTVVQGGLL